MAKESTVAPRERVNITYKPATGDAKEEIELPLKLVMVGDYTQRADDRPDRQPEARIPQRIERLDQRHADDQGRVDRCADGEHANRSPLRGREPPEGGRQDAEDDQCRERPAGPGQDPGEPRAEPPARCLQRLEQRRQREDAVAQQRAGGD